MSTFTFKPQSSTVEEDFSDVKVSDSLSVNAGSFSSLSAVTASINTLSAPLITGSTAYPSACLATDPSGSYEYLSYESTQHIIPPAGGLNNIVARDKYGNSSFNVSVPGTIGFAAAGTIHISIATAQNITFESGAGTANVILPDATTLQLGWTYVLNNNASGNIYVQTYDTSPLFTIPAGGLVWCYLLNNSFAVGQWTYYSSAPKNATWGTNYITWSGNGSTQIPQGTTAQRFGGTGSIRYNTSLGAFEGFNGSTWNTFNMT